MVKKRQNPIKNEFLEIHLIKEEPNWKIRSFEIRRVFDKKKPEIIIDSSESDDPNGKQP